MATRLQKTQGTATSTKKFTFSAWVKKSSNTTSNDQVIYDSNNDANNRITLYFRGSTNNTFNIYGALSGSTIINLETTRLFRDVSAWYHIVVAFDTTQGTAADRIKIYVNGLQETAFNASTYPNQDAVLPTGSSSYVHSLGYYTHGGSSAFIGYLSHPTYCDGTALAPTSFGSTDSTSGIWRFITPSGFTFGNNGFHLKFENSGNLGLDSSGEGNNFTTSTGTPLQSLDTPTNVHATMNPLVTYGTNQNALTEGNNTTTGIAYHRPSPPTIAVNKGKWYFEAKALSGSASKWWIGLCDAEYDTKNQGSVGSSANYIWGYDNTTNAVNQRSQCIYANDLRSGGSIISISSMFSAGAIAVNDIYAMAVDLDNRKVWYSKNGVWHNGSASESTTWNSSYPDDTNLDVDRFYYIGVGGENSKWSVNYGNGFFGTTAITSAGSNGNGSLFEYDVPSGFYALNTKNINTYG